MLQTYKEKAVKAKLIMRIILCHKMKTYFCPLFVRYNKYIHFNVFLKFDELFYTILGLQRNHRQTASNGIITTAPPAV